MFSVIKLINVHYRDETGYPIKLQFKTTLEGMEDYYKRYYIVESNKEREVTLEEGNVLYQQLRGRYPDMRALTIIDVDYNEVRHIQVAEHFEVRLGYDFVCSCDNMTEVREVEEKLKERLR